MERLSVEDIKTRSPNVDRQMKRLAGLTDVIYVHVDMDVLDPPEVCHPLTVPGGPTSMELAAALTDMFRHAKAAAFGVASTPSGDHDPGGRSRTQAAYNLILGALKGVQQRGGAR